MERCYSFRMTAEAARRTVSIIGSVSETARRAEVSVAAVRQWMHCPNVAPRPVPLDKRVLFERETQGRVRVDDYDDGVVWIRTPDPSWPHPLGRPVHDVLSTADRKRAAESAQPPAPLGLAA